MFPDAIERFLKHNGKVDVWTRGRSESKLLDAGTEQSCSYCLITFPDSRSVLDSSTSDL
jgi:hypothetical protein